MFGHKRKNIKITSKDILPVMETGIPEDMDELILSDEEWHELRQMEALARAGVHFCAMEKINHCTSTEVHIYETLITQGPLLGKAMRMAMCDECKPDETDSDWHLVVEGA